MAGWLKFVTLSFFSDEIASEAPRRGYGTMLFSVAIAAALMILGVIGALLAPFRTLYRRSELKSAVEDVFCGAAAPALAVSGGKLSATFPDGEKQTFDTIKYESDGAVTSRGYEVIVDTRSSGLYDDFTAYCVADSGERISYEQYLGLSDDIKKKYRFEIEYSGNERVIGDADVAAFEAYLAASDDPDIAEAYKKLPDGSDAGYKTALYELYVKAYYPDLSKYETGGSAPKLRNYYYHNYTDRKKILFVFDDSIIGRFSSGNVDTTFYGFYDGIGGAVEATPRGMEEFIVKSNAASRQLVLYANASNLFITVPYLVLMIELLAVIRYCVGKLVKDEISFGGAAKTVGAFSLYGGLVGGLMTFALGFAVSQRYFTTVACMAYFCTVLIRIAVTAIVGAIKNSRTNKKGENADDAATAVAADGASGGEQ